MNKLKTVLAALVALLTITVLGTVAAPRAGATGTGCAYDPSHDVYACATINGSGYDVQTIQYNIYNTTNVPQSVWLERWDQGFVGNSCAPLPTDKTWQAVGAIPAKEMAYGYYNYYFTLTYAGGCDAGFQLKDQYGKVWLAYAEIHG